MMAYAQAFMPIREKESAAVRPSLAQ